MIAQYIYIYTFIYTKAFCYCKYGNVFQRVISNKIKDKLWGVTLIKGEVFILFDRIKNKKTLFQKDGLYHERFT